MKSVEAAESRTLPVYEAGEIDVPFVIAGTDITLYLQMHVMRDAAYGVLLGRPFDTLANTIVENGAGGVHRLTLRCPNTGRVAVVPTYNRGEDRGAAKGAPPKAVSATGF